MKKFREKLDKNDLIDFFEDKINFETINLDVPNFKEKERDFNISIVKLKNKIRDFENGFNQLSKRSITHSDSELAPMFFDALNFLPKKELLDVRFWQWLSLYHFENYTWIRWWATKNSTNRSLWPLKTANEKIDQIKGNDKNNNGLWSTVVSRFLGGNSMKSLTSRQALSRLFWPYKILGSKELAGLCFEKQDIAVAVFERQYGLHPEAAKAFITNISIKYPKLEKKNIQYEAKKLNRYFATLATEYLDQEDIKRLIFE